jgi:hypothetical protein
VKVGPGYKPSEACYAENNDDYAILETVGYILPYENITLDLLVAPGDYVLYDNVNNNKPVETEVFYLKDEVFHIKGYAELGNSGTGIFGEDGSLIGILVTHWEDDKSTGVVPVYKEMFEGFEGAVVIPEEK